MRILLVDDETFILNALKRVLRQYPWEVFTALNAQDALTILQGMEFDLMITDYQMPGMNGVALAREAWLAHQTLQIFILSGNLTEKMIPEDLRLKLKLLGKPWNSEELILVIQEVEKALR